MVWQNMYCNTILPEWKKVNIFFNYGDVAVAQALMLWLFWIVRVLPASNVGQWSLQFIPLPVIWILYRGHSSSIFEDMRFLFLVGQFANASIYVD